MRLKKVVVGFLILLGFSCWLFRMAEAKIVRIGIPSHAITQIAQYIAKDKGYYAEEGLEVELIMMAGPIANTALIAKELQFSIVPVAALTAAVRGAPLRIIQTSYFRPLWWMYGTPEIHNVAALKGKKVGVGGIASATGALSIEVLKRYGLEAGRDVLLLSVGVQPSVLAALLTKTIDAAILTAPWNFKAEESGLRRLLDLTKEDLVLLTGSVVVHEDMLRNDRVLVEKFLRSTMKGFLYAKKNSADAIAIAARNIQLSPDLAAKTYHVALPALTEDGTLDPESQRKALDMVTRIREVKPVPPFEQFFDFSLTRKIYRELKPGK
jgi:ABC-type nitrate/sulfonate/bicarbonate transport system substrate-binding protein